MPAKRRAAESRVPRLDLSRAKKREEPVIGQGSGRLLAGVCTTAADSDRHSSRLSGRSHR